MEIDADFHRRDEAEAEQGVAALSQRIPRAGKIACPARIAPRKANVNPVGRGVRSIEGQVQWR
ncbi:MAG: hypothetical protein MnENMB40S_05440 [Rhizobiaceae bacterium MnEN-MB40S]|nr:MAG: hypothetical protein MnENMB40S_05440 [Rhizobiaceae bacterium MnEN-MB40S]